MTTIRDRHFGEEEGLGLGDVNGGWIYYNIGYRLSYEFDESNSNVNCKWSGYVWLFSDEDIRGKKAQIKIYACTPDYKTKYLIYTSGTETFYLGPAPTNSYNKDAGGRCYAEFSGIVTSAVPFKGQEYRLSIESSYYSGTAYGIPMWVANFKDYAPFYLPMVPVGTVYKNRLNQFSAKIGAEFITKNPLDTKDTYYQHGVPVRNDTAPYIYSGKETDYIWWYPYYWSNETTGTLDVPVYIKDPENSSETVFAAKGYWSGSLAESAEEETRIATYELTLTDTYDHYAKYGCVLRGIGSKIVAKAKVTPHYGARITGEYYDPSGKYHYFYNDANCMEAYELQYESELPSGNYVSARTYLYCNGKYLIRLSLSAQIVQYNAPSFTSIAIHRCTAAGVQDDSGDHCLIEWKVSISTILNKNSKNLSISHPDGVTNIALTSYTQSGSLITNADIESSHDIVFTLKDDLNEVVRTLRLSTAGVIMDFLAGGKGIGLGKVAEISEAVEVSPAWYFICHKLKLGETDIAEWMQEIEKRLSDAGL